MKMFCMSDTKESAIILKTAGVESVILTEKNQIEEQVKKIVENETSAILVITEKIYHMLPEVFDNIIKVRKYPLIVKIPNRKSDK